MTRRGEWQIRRILGFGSVNLVSAFTPFLALPILARSLSIGEFAALAIGQSVGGLAAVMTSMGWQVTGPAEAASLNSAGKASLLVESFLSRVTSFAAAGLVGCIVVVVITDRAQNLLAVTGMLSTALAGLNMTWFAIARGTPKEILFYEAVPRATASILGAVAVAVAGAPVMFPAFLIAVSILSIILYLRKVTTCRDWRTVGWRETRRRLRANLSPTLIEFSSGSYSLGASALIGLVAPVGAVAQFNAAERITRLGTPAIIAVTNGMQAWVSDPATKIQTRARKTVFAHTVVGLLGFVLLALLGPLATRVVLGPQFAITTTIAVLFGAYFLALSLHAALGRHVLVTQGLVRALLRATLAGSMVGIPSLLLGGYLDQARGAAIALAGAEIVIVLMIIGPAYRSLRPPSPSATQP